MIQIGECYYMGPRVGDVGLLTTQWRHSDNPETIHSTRVPVLGDVVWWHWMADAPPVVQQVLRKLYTAATEARAQRDEEEESP
jgi:hypothetical protein